MTDREKLEWAAKACRLKHTAYPSAADEGIFTDAAKWWNPLTNQADSDVMACKLRIGLGFFFGFVEAQTSDHTETARHNNTDEDVCRAVREARLLVAAEIGRAK